MNAPCFYCQTPLTLLRDIDVWVDDTEGDCCWGDDDNVNENEPHRPNLDEATFKGSVFIHDRDEWRNIAHTYTMKDALATVNHWRGRGYTVRLVERIVYEREIIV